MESSSITLTKGTKAPGDCKIHWVCNCCGNLYSPKFIDIIEWVVTAYENEDRIYPPSKLRKNGRPLKGRQMLKDAIADREAGMSREDIIKKYKLPHVS